MATSAAVKEKRRHCAQLCQGAAQGHHRADRKARGEEKKRHRRRHQGCFMARPRATADVKALRTIIRMRK